MTLSMLAVVVASFVVKPSAISTAPRQRLPTPLRCCAAAPAFAAPTGGESDESYSVRVLFDSACAVCLTNKAMLTFFDKKKRLRFVDVASDSYLPEANGGISYDDAMAQFHVAELLASVLCTHSYLASRFRAPEGGSFRQSECAVQSQVSAQG